MSTDRETARIVRSWLREDGHENADRVLDLVLDQIDTTPQRRATWWPVRRLMTMNTTTRYGIAAAAVALAALVGFTLINNQLANKPSPTPSPSGTAITALPAALEHPFLGPARTLPGILGEPSRANLIFDGSTFRFDKGDFEVLASTASVTDAGQLRLVTATSGFSCNEGDEGLYDYEFSPGGSFLTISGTDDCAAREAAVVGTWQTSNCRNPNNFCLGNLEAGTFSSNYFEPRPEGEWVARYGAMTYTVPEGWAASSDFPEGYALMPQAAYATTDPASDGCSACPDGIGIWAAPQAAPKDCSEAAEAGVGTTAAELADWVEQNSDFVVERQSGTIDGRSAIVLDVEVADGVVGTCGEAGEAGAPIFFNGWHMAIAAGDRQRFVLLDLGGGDTIMINIDTFDPATFDAFVAQAMPIVNTFHFPPR